MRPLYQEVFYPTYATLAAAVKSLIGWNLNRFDVKITFPMLLVNEPVVLLTEKSKLKKKPS
jgi:hypothetical protein